MRAGICLLIREYRAICVRCRVPIRLIQIVGKREIVRSLRTEQCRWVRALAASLALLLPE